MLRSTILFIALALCAPALRAQTYATGEHTMQAPVGQLRINSGFVAHQNAHSFHVYTFLFRPDGTETWHQVPVIREIDAPAMEFTVRRTATADFTTRDAVAVPHSGGLRLTIAALDYASTPYDADAVARIEHFRLEQLEEEGRWIFLLYSNGVAQKGESIEDVIRKTSGGAEFDGRGAR